MTTANDNKKRDLRSRPARRVDPWESVVRRGLDESRSFVSVEGNSKPLYTVPKRVFDLAGGLFLLFLFSPIMLVILIALTVTTRGRPFFTQQRIGLGGNPFTMFKFRTMRLDAEKVQHLVKNEKDGPIFKNEKDARITMIGRFLRKTSLDETPQIFNVLLGQMSLVGPRPPIGKEVAKYEPWQLRRLAVKPGLTCLWQVSGRSEIGFTEWVRMDIWYLSHQTLWTDCKLLLKTPLSIITGRGAY